MKFLSLIQNIYVTIAMPELYIYGCEICIVMWKLFRTVKQMSKQLINVTIEVVLLSIIIVVCSCLSVSFKQLTKQTVCSTL